MLTETPQFLLPEAVDNLGLPSVPIEHNTVEMLVFDEVSGEFITIEIQRKNDSAAEAISSNEADGPLLDPDQDGSLPDPEQDWIVYRNPDSVAADADTASVKPPASGQSQLVNWEAKPGEVNELFPRLLPGRANARSGLENLIG